MELTEHNALTKLARKKAGRMTDHKPFTRAELTPRQAAKKSGEAYVKLEIDERHRNNGNGRVTVEGPVSDDMLADARRLLNRIIKGDKMNCRAIQDFVYNGHMVYVGSTIDIPDIEIPLYREYLDCSVSGTGKDPKIEDPTP